jgi:diguanylate cyclase (GGDEF)-like protein
MLMISSPMPLIGVTNQVNNALPPSSVDTAFDDQTLCIQQELDCARALTALATPCLPADYANKLQAISQCVMQLTRTSHCQVLLKDDTTGQYHCLMPLQPTAEQTCPRAYTRLTPASVTQLMGPAPCMSSFLTHVHPNQDGNQLTDLIGFILVSGKQAPNAIFTAHDQAQLERVAYYLSPILQQLTLAQHHAQRLQTLQNLALTDELTGLHNRRGLYQQFERELERARRMDQPLAVAVLDVDHFKAFNDDFGHLAGDQVLKQLAQLLASNIRKNDVVCRFGGEEFVILLPQTPLGPATDLLNRIVACVRQSSFGFSNTAISISAGVSVFMPSAPLEEETSLGTDQAWIDALLNQADERLYKAKHQGRDRVCGPLP